MEGQATSGEPHADRNAPLPTVAWLMKGAIGSTQGVLELVRGRLAFTTTEQYRGAGLRSDQRITDGGRVFDAPLSDVTEVKWPWYYFGGGVKLKFGDEKYRLSFVKPGNTQAREWQMPSDVASGRQAAKLWKPVLTSRTA